nr:hypothetical protein [Lentisphaeria bacterium]
MQVIRIIMFAMLACVSQFLSGGSRLTDEEIEELREEEILDKLLESPFRNFGKIGGRFLHRRNPGLEDAVKAVEARLQTEKDPLGKAALALLVARGETALMTGAALAMRDPSMMRDLPPVLLPMLSEAYASLPDGAEADTLRPDFVREINRLLLDDGAGDLTDDEKKQLVENYLHSPRNPMKGCPVDRLVAIHRRLGVLRELEDKCEAEPSEIPEESDLLLAMRLARELNGSAAALPYADEMLARKASSVRKEDGWLLDLWDVYADEPAHALETLPRHADRWPMCRLVLFDASCRAGRGDGKSREAEWLKPYMDYLSRKDETAKTPEEVRSLKFKRTFASVTILVNRRIHEGVIYMGRRTEEPALEKDERSRDYWEIIVAMARAYAAMGMRKEA